MSNENNTEVYIQDYRHFDNLIWQVPAWASAVFSFSMTASILALANRISIDKSLSIDVPNSVAVFLLSVFLVLILLTNVFLKFRLHQRSIYRPYRKQIPSCWFMISGQTSLLLALFLEASVVLCFSLILFGLAQIIAYIISGVFMVFGFSYVEWSVRKLTNKIKSQREPKKISVIGGQENSP